MWELDHEEGWVLKNWCFWTVVLEEILEEILEGILAVPLDYKEISREKKTKNTRRSNQSILKEINLDYSLEGLMLKLKLQYFGHLMQRANSLEKILMLRKAEGRRKRGRQRMRWLDGITKSITWVWASSRRWWRTRKPGMLQSVGCKESDTTEQLTTTLFHWKSPTGYRKDKNCSVAFSSLPPLPPVSLIFQQVFIYN